MVASITATDVQFTSSNSNGGGRLIEIDAIGAMPEPATWAMMIVGLRYRRQSAKVSFA